MTIEDYRHLIDLIVQAAVAKVEEDNSANPTGYYEADRNAAADALLSFMMRTFGDANQRG